MQLILAKDGLFPICSDRDIPATKFLVTGTVQGEGKLAGMPSLFLRLAGCNLRCMWRMKNGELSCCDTPYASFYQENTSTLDISEIVNRIQKYGKHLKHLVITGGEPLLQRKALAALCKEVNEKLKWHITLETNATIFDEELSNYIDLFSLSPKLENSEPNEAKYKNWKEFPLEGRKFYDAELRCNTTVIQRYIDVCNNSTKELQLKFVLANKTEENEIKTQYLDKLKNLNNSDVMLMPLGRTNEELALSEKNTMEVAIKNGWRFSPRIHIKIFGNKSGV